MRYVSKPSEIEAVQWIGDNWPVVKQFAAMKIDLQVKRDFVTDPPTKTETSIDPAPRVATYRTPKMHVEITPRKGQGAESVEADLKRSAEMAYELLGKGVQQFRSHYRWVGPFKLARTKEVAPPPWRFPKVYAAVRRGPLTLAVGAGWRSTAYEFFVMWARASDAGETPLTPRECGRGGDDA